MPRLCLGLSDMPVSRAVYLTQLFGRLCYAVKIHDLYDEKGPLIIRTLKEAGARRVWVDAKLHDIPKTVAKRVHALAGNGADIITVHATGGVSMMRVAVEAAKHHVRQAGTVQIWGITVLTSLDEGQVVSIYGSSPGTKVEYLACTARNAGVDGIVCSAHEVGTLSKQRELAGVHFIVPGTRCQGAELGDQKRSATPAEAARDGATMLVLESQITSAENPTAAFEAVMAEIGESEETL